MGFLNEFAFYTKRKKNMSLESEITMSKSDFKYPSHWWGPVIDPNLPYWEILPQQADRNKNEVIISKRTELGLLSNFAPTPFIYKNKAYQSLEGLWQSMKYPDPTCKHSNHLFSENVHWEHTRDQVTQMAGFDAYYAGKKASANMEKLNIKWISFAGEKIDYKGAEKDKHYQIIFEASLAKVQQNPSVERILRMTGDLILKPDHEQLPTDPPAWRYYDIYMKIRSLI